AVGNMVESTLGPKGMNKILLSSARYISLTATKDGATILKNIDADNSAAKVLVDTSRVQDEVGDGTTSVTLLAAELLRKAESIITITIHPQTIIALERSHKAAREALLNSAGDRDSDEFQLCQDIIIIVGVTVSSKLLTHHKNHFAKLAVEAVLRLKDSNLEAIHAIKKLGSLTDSYLDEGFLLDKNNWHKSTKIENTKILIANNRMDMDKIKIFGSQVRVDFYSKVCRNMQEKKKMKEKIEHILKCGISYCINRKLIYNYPEQLFDAAGVMAIEHTDFPSVEYLALVTGGEIASTSITCTELVKLGSCKRIEEIMIGEDKLIHFVGVALGEACRIILHGATQQILDKTERSLHNALCILTQTVKDSKTTDGGGRSEMLMAYSVTQPAFKTQGKEALPIITVDSAGYDSEDLGLDMRQGTIGDMAVLGMTESFKVKQQVHLSAAEAEVILSVDTIIKDFNLLKMTVESVYPC
uniref:T-complex protein 1 subunit beta n=1 Tax=Otolemur garnettii TaxID=30611 RepID=H0XPI3_OTOGA